MKTVCFERIDSTSSYLKRNYESLEDMTFVSASVQFQGRGRNNRHWSSEKGENLLFSLLIKDERLMERYACISMLMAYSVLNVLESCQLSDIAIKWPNDVYVKGKKICGILLEGIIKEKMECLIVGIGLNVNQKTFAADLLHQPTSMAIEKGCETELPSIREKIYRQICFNLKQLETGHDFYEEISCFDYLKGKEAWAIVHSEKKKVKILGIERDYTLKVQTDDEIVCLNSGEISFHL